MAEYIDRDALMTALHSGNIDLGFVYKETYRKLREYSREVDKVVKSIPTADVAPVRRAVWCPQPSDFEDCTLFACSNCGHLVLLSNEREELPYCGNCGARMVTE